MTNTEAPARPVLPRHALDYSAPWIMEVVVLRNAIEDQLFSLALPIFGVESVTRGAYRRFDVEELAAACRRFLPECAVSVVASPDDAHGEFFEVAVRYLVP